MRRARIVPLALFFSVLFCTAALADDPIKIGVIAPLSGDMALHGQELQRAMQLAERNHSETRRKYQLIFEDNRLEQRLSISAARKLLDIDHVNAVVTLWPPTALTVLPLTEQASVLHYTISWDPEIAATHRFVLSHQALVTNIVKRTFELLRTEGPSEVAFLHMEEVGFNMGAGVVRKIAPEYGIDFVADETFLPDEKDFRSLIAKVRKQNPPAWLIWSVMPSMDILVSQLRAVEPKAFITGYLDYAENMTSIEGAKYVSEMYAEPFFVEQYRKAYGAEPISKGANAYDIYNLLIDAYERFDAPKPGAAEMKQLLVTTKDRHGAVGTFSIDEDGNSTYMPVIRMIRNGRRELQPNTH